MKINKKIITILAIVLFLFDSNSVLASDSDIGSSFTITKTNEYTNVLSGVSSIYGYSATSGSGEKYDAFCVDPQKQFLGGTYTVKTGTDETYLAGVAVIVGSNANYVSKDIALRAFSYGVMHLFGKYSASSSGQTDLRTVQLDMSKGTGDKASAFVNMGIDWACDSTNEAYTKQIGGFDGDCETYLKGQISKYYTYHTENYYTSSYDAEAKELFNLAMAAAADVNNSDDEESEKFTLTATLDKVTNEESEVIIPATFKFEGISKDDFIKNINFECPDCSKNGFTFEKMEYSINNGEYQALENNSDTNLLESIIKSAENSEDDSWKNGVISLKITLSKSDNSDDDEECEPTSFTINYKYSGVTKYNAVLLESNADQQKMIINVAIGEGNQTEKEDKLEGEIPCEKEICETKISAPVCEEDGGGDVFAPTEIKKCILDNYDDAHNSYQLTVGNSVVDNDYCKVFCKEDYKNVMGENEHGIILQPIITDVVCGGYFKLNAHIEGQKDCYTGGETTKNATNGEGSIDKDLYIDTIKNDQKDMVDAMTEYNKAVAQLEGNGKATPVTETLTCNNQTYELFEVTVNWDNYTQYKFEWDEGNEVPKVTDSKGGKDKITFSDKSISCNAVYDDDGNKVKEELSGEINAKKNYDTWVESIEKNKDAAIDKMDTAFKDYEQQITDYNSCLTAWSMEFKFAQKIQYYYDETRGSLDDFSTSIPYYSLLEDDEKYLEAIEDTYGEEAEINICTGTASEEYECEGNTLTVTMSVEDMASINLDGEYAYSSSYDSAFETKEYVICNAEEGCVSDSVKVSQASFVKKSIRKKQDYITPSVFCQDEANGKITTNCEYAGDDVKLERLENALPLSTKSVVGGNFKLIIEDLGEFYDSDNVGRLIDFNAEDKDRVVANYVESTEEVFDGEYLCHYESLCKPADCPECVFVGSPLQIIRDVKEICINCIFNYDKPQFNVKPITNTDVVSVDRDYGYNWVVNTSLEELTLLSQKAEQTINEIEESNDLVYNSNKVSDGSGLAFSIKLDSAMISKIKEYNKGAEGKGGYANDSLTCYDAQIGEDTISNLYCYSDLIDILLSMNDSYKYFPEDIYDVRVSESQRSDENNSANGGSTNGYWKLWTDETLDIENIEGNGWSYEYVGYDDKTGQSEIIGGPAWR